MLTQEQLVDIHVLHRQGLSNRDIARRLVAFGVDSKMFQLQVF